jgi:hypothetical protein
LRLIPIPITDEALLASAPHWLPFLPKIARRSKEPIEQLVDRIMQKQVRIALVWDDPPVGAGGQATGKAMALLGVTMHMRGPDIIAEWIWMAGTGRKQWEHLLSELEQMLREAGCVECRPLCRPGWRKILERAGYKLTHVQMEKRLWAEAAAAAHNSR